MNGLVTYGSAYGSTQKYAQWIAEELSFDIKAAEEADGAMLARYDIIIHGGGLYAGGVKGIQVITKNYASIAHKPVILFTCGLADPEDQENVAHIEAGLAKVLSPEMQKHIKLFHFRGGIDYSRLGLVHRAMMAMLRKSMLRKGRDNLRQEDKLMLDIYGKKVDFTDRQMIAPLIEDVKQIG